MSSLTAAQLESAIRQLLRHFGNQLDKEVLENVLEMCGGDVQQTITFLSAQSDSAFSLSHLLFRTLLLFVL